MRMYVSTVGVWSCDEANLIIKSLKTKSLRHTSQALNINAVLQLLQLHLTHGMELFSPP
ncbi:hypothetical protein SAMN04487897_14314 [Paenibacillus sp. yr247]|nr:hypothetical protein SAMN04487897_14314 [Paenibacillus sp. yr247]